MIIIKSNFTTQYIESLDIIYCKQPEMWEYFCDNIPIFSKVNNYDSLVSIAKKVHKENYNIIVNSKTKYEKYLINNNIEEVLYDIFKVKINNVKAYICITPLFTRNIYNNSFLLPTNANKKRFYNIVIHEIIHFYYYKKVNKSKLLLDDNTIWKISELIVDPIIKIMFPKYYINDNKYNFTSEERKLSYKTVKQFINKEIDFENLLGRLKGE